MDLRTSAKDWQVASIAQMGGAGGLGGGAYWFTFHSPSAGGTEAFMFLGLGVGVGGSIGGTSLNPASAASIECDRSFSVYDLDSSTGRVTFAGASFMVGYSLLYISAFNLSGSLFSSQEVHGYAAGVGAGGITLVGMWRSHTLAGQDARKSAEGYLRTRVPSQAR